MSRRATSDYNLAVTHPAIVKEWHKTKNKNLTPKDVTPGSNRKVWWKCASNHEWEAIVKSKSKGRGCPECAGKKAGKDNNLSVKYPNLAKEWHKTKNKNLTPKDVTSGSGKIIWWQCKKGHEWEAVIASRSRGGGCPECAGRKVGKDNNLSVKYPTLAKEWHKTKNKDLTPKDVTPGSGKIIWWQCKKGHEWESTTDSRTKGRGCPECAGKKAGKDNNLSVKYPTLAKEWHKTKNKDLTPKDVTPGSGKKVWWMCKNNHEWEATIVGRSGGNGCSRCYNEKRKIIR